MNAKPYPKYKPSGGEWLGDVPNHWEVKRLKTVVQLADKKIEADEETPLQYIALENISSWTGQIHSLDADVVPTGIANWFPRGVTLFGKLRPYLAKACNPDFEGLCSSELLVLEPRELNRRFLLHLLLSGGFIENVNSSTYGSKMPRANWEFIGGSLVPVAPTEEQQAIADFLDDRTAKLDALLEKKRALIGKLKEKRSALISRTVTKGLPYEAAAQAGLTPNSKLKSSGIDGLGDIPEGWDVWKFTHFNPITTCGVASTPEYVDEGIPFLSAQNIKRNRVLFENHKYIAPEAHAVLTRYRRPSKGDVLLSRVGTIGEAAIVPDDREFSIFVSLTHIRVDPRICLNRYLLLYFNSAHFQQYVKVVTLFGGGVGNFNVNDLRELRVPLPSLPEQTAIAEFLDLQTAKIDRMIQKVEIAIEKLTEYRTALITAAVTGKIDVRHR